MTLIPSITRVFYGWWIVAACLLIGLFAVGSTNYCFTAFIEPIAQEFNWSYTQISFAASLRVMEVGLASPVLGWLVDRWGTRKIILIGTAITCLGLLLLSQTQSLAVFYAAFVLIGIGVSGGSQTVIMPIIARWFRKRTGLATGIAISGYGLSGLLLPAITSIIALFGWRAAIVAILLSIIIIVLPLVAVIRDKPEKYGLFPDGEIRAPRKSSDILGDKPYPDSGMNLKQALQSNAFWKLAFAFTVLYLILAAVTTHSMPYLASIGMDRYTASLFAGAMPIISVIGRIGCGWFGDRLNSKVVTAATFLMVGAAMLCFGFAATIGTWLVVPFLILFGVGYGGGMSMSGAFTRELFGSSHFGSILGLILGINLIGNMAGAPLAGWVYDNWRTYEVFWLITAGGSIAAMIIILTISMTSKNERH